MSDMRMRVQYCNDEKVLAETPELSVAFSADYDPDTGECGVTVRANVTTLGGDLESRATRVSLRSIRDLRRALTELDHHASESERRMKNMLGRDSEEDITE